MKDMLVSGGQRAALVGSAVVGLLFMGAVLAGPASAAPAGAEEAITGLGADVTLYGLAVIAVVVIAVGFTLAVKYLRKAASKA